MLGTRLRWAAVLLAMVVVAVHAKPLVQVVFEEGPGDDVQLLGQTGGCKAVSIPAKSTCGPGLVCNPNSGTCVPDGYHLKKYFLGKMFNYGKIPRIHFNSLDKSKPSKLQEFDIQLQRAPWS